MEFLIHKVPYKRNGGDRTDVAGDLQGADVLLDTAFTYVSPIDLEIKVKGLQGSLQAGLVDLAFFVDDPGLESVECDSPVHRSGVKVEE